MNGKERNDLAKWVTLQIKKNGAKQSSVVLSHRRKIEIEFRNGEIENLKESSRNMLGIDLYVDNKFSSHSTSNLNKENLKKFIEETVAITKYLSADKFRTLPDPDLYENRKTIDLKICDESYKNIETKHRIDLVKKIENAARQRTKKLISVTAGYTDTYSDTVIINSNGFSGERVSTNFLCGAEATVKDGEKGRPEDYYYSNTRLFKELPSPEFLGEKAVDLALRKIGQKKIKSGVYDMIVENRSVGRILSALFSPLSAVSIQQKRSFLGNKKGEIIASPKLTITDDPFIPGGLGSRLFDDEGISSVVRTIIKEGVLKNFFVDNYYGKKLGFIPNSGSTSNIVFKCGKKDPNEMIKSVNRGILVTSFIGGNSNPTTGDFSFGIMGLLVENGEITMPVNEMNITGNMLNLWDKLIETGNDPYPYSSWRTPSLHFKNIQFSGK